MSVDATPDRIAIWHHAVSASDEPHSNEADDLRRRVWDAIGRSFHRTADTDASNVGVVCESGVVWLSGRVHSFAARTTAENTAWAIPGVTQVNNDIVVGSFDPKLGGEIGIDD